MKLYKFNYKLKNLLLKEYSFFKDGKDFVIVNYFIVLKVVKIDMKKEF